MKSLASWSWQDLTRVYRIFGQQLIDYKDIADRFEIAIPMEYPKLDLKPGDVISVADANHLDFIGRWYRDVVRANNQLKALDREIARRNNLIGVMG